MSINGDGLLVRRLWILQRDCALARFSEGTAATSDELPQVCRIHRPDHADDIGAGLIPDVEASSSQLAQD